MHELKPLLGSEAQFLGKWEPHLLHQHTDVVELLHVVKPQHAWYYLLGTDLLQGLKVKVPETPVPLSRLVVLTNSETEGLCYLHIEDIESIRTSSYLSNEATMVIPNPYDSILDLHARTVLIQLFQADDRVSQCRNVVDFGEQSVLTRLSDEDDRADALDLHVGGVSKLDGASDIRVKLSEELTSIDHVIGGTGVEAPPVSFVIAGAVAEEDVCSRLIKVEESRCGRCRWR
jgi:hypothetical protein